MPYFVYKPDQNALAMESRAHWKRQVEILEARVAFAKETYDKTQETYDAQTAGFKSNYELSKKVDAAQEELFEARRMVKAARIKLRWEDDGRWSRVPKPERGLAKYKRLLLKSIDWASILKRDKPVLEDE